MAASGAAVLFVVLGVFVIACCGHEWVWCWLLCFVRQTIMFEQQTRASWADHPANLQLNSLRLLMVEWHRLCGVAGSHTADCAKTAREIKDCLYILHRSC